MSYIVPIGPYHPALEEPIHAKLYPEGEVIKDAEVFGRARLRHLLPLPCPDLRHVRGEHQRH